MSYNFENDLALFGQQQHERSTLQQADTNQQFNFVDTYWKTMLQISKSLQNMFDDAAHEFAFTGSVRPPTQEECMNLMSFGRTLMQLSSQTTTSTEQQTIQHAQTQINDLFAPWLGLKDLFPPAITSLPVHHQHGHLGHSNVTQTKVELPSTPLSIHNITPSTLPNVSSLYESHTLNTNSSITIINDVDSPLLKRETNVNTEQRFQPYASAMSRSRRVRKGKTAKLKNEKVDRSCAWCGVKSTPEWRNGPEYSLLCNACGLQYRNQLKREAKESSSSGSE
ncbi:hypothetical protein PROFUN_08933 [Planoprotostelium fungivorum]|uniref:GATA-type domain-containing protein n=1 Tax=Planoprotostelium fungivorum TaxID=1890364 RepID=A0A2P6NIM7_9EUKA|nr:hypothetical protein PROFUN_08933 [Planoprotostelium fungivorum]